MTLFDRVFGGNDYNYARTVAAIDNAIAQYGEGEAVAFPDTAYSLPCYYGVTGVKITNLGEMKAAMDTIKGMMTRNKRLQDAFDSGIASALCAEFLEALKYLHGATPYQEPEMGHLSDAFVRNLGVPLVTGDIPGVAVIIGGAEDPAETVALAKSYQAQGILVSLTGDAIKHCYDAGMKLGENVRVVPLGYEMQSVIHVVSVAIRAALIFGNITPGDFKALSKYTMDRIRAFVNAYKPLSDAHAVRITFRKERITEKSTCPGKCFFLEQAMGVEPTSKAWEAFILPMNYACVFFFEQNNSNTSI